MRLSVENMGFTPVDIKLHQLSRILEVTFDNGEVFKLPCEYMRVYTPSAEALGHAPGQEILQTGKEQVNISEIKAVGNYGIEPTFTDGHCTGIYSWDLLYKLGSEYQNLWVQYLEALNNAGYQRKETLQN
jgi:DUF971 family protein